MIQVQTYPASKEIIDKMSFQQEAWAGKTSFLPHITIRLLRRVFTIWIPPTMPNMISVLSLSKSAPKFQRRICGVRVFNVVYRGCFACLVLTGVGAGVLGSKISSKKGDTFAQERFVLNTGIKRARSIHRYPILRLKSPQITKISICLALSTVLGLHC